MTFVLSFSSHYVSIQRLHAELEEREARLRAQEEEMQQRDAEINKLMRELRRCRTELQLNKDKQIQQVRVLSFHHNYVESDCCV